MTRACRCREAKFPAGVMCSGSRGSSAPGRLPGPGEGEGLAAGRGAARSAGAAQLGWARRGLRPPRPAPAGAPAAAERWCWAPQPAGNIHESLAPCKLRREVSIPAVGRSVGLFSLPL